MRELKSWRDEQAHQRGLRQFHDYLTRTGVDCSCLVIFDLCKEQHPRQEQTHLQVDGKDVLTVWV